LKSNSAVSILAIMMLLLLTLYSIVVVVLASVDSTVTVTSLAQAKKKPTTATTTTTTSSSSSHHRTASTTTTPNTGTSNTEVSPQNNDDEDNSNYQPSSPPSTLSLSPSSERPHDVPAPSPEEQQATVQRLFVASAIAAADGDNGNGVSGDDNGDSTNFNSQIDQQRQEQQQPCLDSSYIDKFILPFKDARFTYIRPCVTVTGTVISGQKINADGDITFNMAVDPPYEGMLAPGNLDLSRASSSGEHGIHVEVICQEPIVSSAPMNVGACDGYNGPDFHSSLPTDHEHVMVTGRFQIEWNEAPGGLTEIHPVYDIKTIPRG
jgi:hypothetical protein